MGEQQETMPPQVQPRPGIESKMSPRPAYQAPLYQAAEKLKDKVALITGGDSGIGRAIAVVYAKEGADCAIVYLEEEQSDAEETRAAVVAEGRKCLLIPGDVTDPEFCKEAVRKTVSKLGKLDILVNNAAYQELQEKLEDLSIEQFDKTFRTNMYGYFFMAKAALPELKEGAVIINTGSVTGIRGSKDLVDYAATKGAIHAFTKSLALQLVPRKIRVNCVAPGPKVPMKRPGQPEEVAPAYVFLASTGDSSYIAGEILAIVGGETTV